MDQYTRTLLAQMEAVNSRLRAHEAQLALVSEKLGIPFEDPAPSVPPDVVELARAGKHVEAMKRYRELTGASTEDARNIVFQL
jgi:ribosomal protein L7/L12